MTALDTIQSAEQRVAAVQHGLDTVQDVLIRAEEVAAAGQTARRRGRQLLVVATLAIAIGVVVLLVRRRNRPDTSDESDLLA